AAIISLGRDMTALAETKLKGREVPIYTIPNWAELDLIGAESKESNSILKELELVEQFIFLYAGNMGRTHDIESIADLAAEMRSFENVHFLFVGFGAKKEWLEKTRADKDLNNITILPAKARSEQPIFLNACDVAIISFVSGMAGVSVPSRMYNQMAAGKPILAIADKNSELAMVVEEEKIGWVVAPGDFSGLCDTYRQIMASPELCRKMGARAEQVAKNKYSFRRAIVSYREALEEIASS
ncbi:MAG: glycosyltransferase family 4 protein, partial [Myxococcota bacterium]|nr:glycosyltransferase family 4 protein [Myxococcota bacterium]